jgi:alcohol dehydrogenase
MVAQAMGAKTIGVDIKPEALECAIALGATHVLHSRPDDDIAPSFRDLTAGGAHLSLDALGSPATCWNSIACLRKRGRHVQVGLLLAGDGEPRLPMHLVVGRELEILGSHGMPAPACPALLELIQAGRLNPGRLVRKTVSLEEAPAELRAMGEFRGTGVTVIDRFA